MFCPNCGNEVSENAIICVKCGVGLKNQNKITEIPEGKDWLVTLLLCFFLGYLGIHRFYTGSTGIGVAQLLTLGGCGIWVLVDFIMILTNSYTDGEGKHLVKS
ncbi:MAG: TM2 domain-containing protein [Paludibacter sp.]|jgi:TM2 domain-containing membrane protein YozV|nr:TM2 domain-containing protein [Paludibacter sp.]